jgi:predicted amidohydrolase
MSTQRRGRQVLWLMIAGMVVGACILVYVLAPDPTILLVSVMDAETGAPLDGAHVWVKAWGGQPLPTAITDETGVARFEELPPSPAYHLRIQKIDYALAFDSQVTVPEEQKTEIIVSLSPQAGARLFVGLEKAKMTEIDTASLLIVQTIRLPGEEQAPVQHLLLHPDQDLIYAAVGPEAYAIDRQSGASLGRLEIPCPPNTQDSVETWGLSDDGQYLFVVGTWQRGPLMILDAHSGQLLNDVDLHDVDVQPQVFILQKAGSPGLHALQFDEGEVRATRLDAILPEVLAGLPLGILRGAILSAGERYVYDWLGPWYFDTDSKLHDQVHIRQIDVTPTILNTRTLATGISALAASPTKQETYLLNATMGTFTILDPMLGDVQATRRCIERLRPSCAGADLMVLPELCNSGYNFESAEQAWVTSEEISDSVYVEYLESLCQRHGCHVVSGLNERDGDRLYNSAVLVGPQGYAGRYRKLHLFMNEKDYFQPGDEGLPVFDIGLCRVGMLICFDWQFPEAWRVLALKGADVICHPANLVLPGLAQQAVPVHALTSRVYAVTANRIGTERDLTFTGLSTIATPAGQVLVQASPVEEAVRLADVDIGLARDKNVTARNDILADRRPQEYARLSQPAATV